MNYKETGFRAFYHHFCVLPLTKNTKASLREFPGAENANGVLTYGYYDRQAGLTLEVLAAAYVKEGNARFENTVKDIRSFIRIGAVAEDEFLFIGDEDGALARRYTEKIEILHHYDADEEVEKTRDMSFLDSCRHEECIDDVLVYLVREGLKPEGCWTRIIGLGDHFIMGTLLNEPDQNFGYHEGEKIAFFVQENDKKEIICYSDMNPSAKITAEDLEDGSMLEAAVSRFDRERNEQNLISIMEILRDSYVWVPCNAIMSDTDQARIEALIKGAENNLDAMKGKEFIAHDETRLVPDILQNGEKLFFPIFSTAEVMGDYGNGFSKIQKHMLDVIKLARNNEKEPVGIVLNAFSEPFVLDKEIWDLVEDMKSRIEK